MFVSSSLCYCYHLVNVVSLGLAQSDPIKQRLVYQASVMEFIKYKSTVALILDWTSYALSYFW
jgi:hypothetical protein